MNGDSNNDWRFKGFVQGGGGAYNRTLAVDTPASRANFQAQYGNGPVNAVNRTANSPSGTDWNTAFRPATATPTPSQSGSNWNATFTRSPIGANNPASPSGTDWSKTFKPTWAGNQPQTSAVNRSPAWTDGPLGRIPQFDPAGRIRQFGDDSSFGKTGSYQQGSSFSFNLSSASDRSQLNLGSDLNFYRNRLADSNITKRDHEMYGAGSDYGFNF